MLAFVTLSLLSLFFQEGQANSITPSDLQKILVNPKVWNAAPIIDWDKFLAKNPKAPMVYDPPQRYGKGSQMVSMPLIGEMYDTDLDYYFVDEARTLTPEEIEACGKPNAAKVSEDLYEKLLRAHPDSSKIPEPFRNKLFWMEDNHMAEELCSFNNWAWRSQSSKGPGRAIALGCIKYDWTNDASKKGAFYATYISDLVSSIQQSPCKKWAKLALVNPDGTCGNNWMTMYIIQEGDVLVDRDGNPVPNVSPGDIIRISYGDGSDPYECDLDKIVFTYMVRRVAKLNEETGEVERDPYHSAIMAKVNAKLPVDMVDAKDLSVEEKFDLGRESVCDLQLYRPSPTPPSGDDIENL